MSFRLDKSVAAVAALTLPEGVSIAFRRPTSWEMETANAAAQRTGLEVRKGTLLADMYGIGDTSKIEVDENAFAGFYVVVYVNELAFMCAESWDGILNETGGPAPLTRENMAALLKQAGFFTPVRDHLFSGQILTASEKKTSGSSSNGGSAAEETSAAPAAKPELPVLEEGR